MSESLSFSSSSLMLSSEPDLEISEPDLDLVAGTDSRLWSTLFVSWSSLRSVVEGNFMEILVTNYDKTSFNFSWFMYLKLFRLAPTFLAKLTEFRRISLKVSEVMEVVMDLLTRLFFLFSVVVSSTSLFTLLVSTTFNVNSNQMYQLIIVNLKNNIVIANL